MLGLTRFARPDSQFANTDPIRKPFGGLRPAGRRPLHRRAVGGRFRLAVAAGMWAGLLPVAGCTITVVPPAQLRDPVPVFIADYGKHASLLLPRSASEMVEYAYGEWRWFALNEDQWYRSLPVVSCPSQGTLGKRELDLPPDADCIGRMFSFENLYQLEVERSDVERLVARLDARFELHRDTSVENPLSGLTFVHDDAPYCLLRQCNSRVAKWLRELGCGIRGVPFHANFDVRNPIDLVQPARPVTLAR